jgi:Tol biopolymer transport system component
VVYVSTDNGHEEKIAWRQKLDGSEPEKITSFGNERIFDLAVSPNGSTLAVAQGEWKYDATLITGLK